MISRNVQVKDHQTKIQQNLSFYLFRLPNYYIWIYVGIVNLKNELSFKYGLAACARWLFYFVRLLNKPLKLFVATTLVLSALLGDALPEIYTYIISHQLKEARFSTVPSSPSSMDIQTHSSSTWSSQVVFHPSTDRLNAA